MKNKIRKIGYALEAFGMSILGVGIADLSRMELLIGLGTMAIGRALVAYDKN